MKISKYAIIFFISIFPLLSFAVEDDSNQGTITGVIVDSKTENPVQYASVALLNSDNENIITGVITDLEGNFVLDKIPYGNYTLKISFLGYKSEIIENIEVSKKNKKIFLSKTKLIEKIESLESVSVTKERLKGEEKIDRTVFTVNDDIRSASTNGLDALKHIPAVTVDFQENVTLDGESNIQFYVDGILRNKDYVAQLDPKMIDKIEIMTNPGVKYDADISGVINIILTKEKRYGVSGMATVPIPNPEKIVANPHVSLEYGTNKFRVYAGDRMHFEQFNGEDMLYTRLDNDYENYRNGEGKNRFQFNNLNYGIDFFINDKTSLNFFGEWGSGRVFAHDFLTENSMFNYNSAEDQYILSSYYETMREGNNNNDNVYSSLFFKRKGNKEGTELTMEIYTNNELVVSDDSYKDTYFTGTNFSIEDYAVNRVNLTENSRQNMEAKIDYTFLTGNIKHEAGARYFSQWINNSFTNNFSIENIDNENEEKFEYAENRQVLYYNITGKLKNINWQAGARGELANIDINNISDAQYFSFLPRVNLSRNFEKAGTIKFSYRRQVYRPGITQLNPFTVWNDSLHYRIGNPDLKPALENKFELTHSINFKSNYISPKLYFRHTENGIQDLSIIDENGVTEIRQDNIGKNTEYGIGLNAAIQVLKKWRVNGDFTVFNRIVGSDHELSLDENDEMVSYRFGLTNIVMLPKDFTLIGMMFYNSPNISYQREFRRDLLAMVGVEKKINDKMKASAFYVPFIKDFTYSSVITQSPGYYEKWSGLLDAQHLFAFEFTYNFNYGKKVKKINRSTDYEKTDQGGGI